MPIESVRMGVRREAGCGWACCGFGWVMGWIGWYGELEVVLAGGGYSINMVAEYADVDGYSRVRGKCDHRSL
jgi:hypothetical protein